MRRAFLTALAIALAAVIGAPAAHAHPLGNFSINHVTEVEVSADEVQALYILDQAEIPTFQERGSSPAEVLERKRAEVGSGLTLRVDGRAVPLRFNGSGRVLFLPGQGGLRVTRVELPLTAAISDPRRVELRDNTFGGRVGWKAIVPKPGTGTAVRANVPATDPTRGLRSYPEDMLESPLDERSASLTVEPGAGTVTAPRLEGGGSATTTNRAGDGLAKLFGDAAAGEGVLVLLLLAAFGWGALHALSPGHGKAMVAAYLVGTRGTARHAFALGGVVTFTHTIGVFALGVVTLALSQFILPEDLYPWLNLASGLLVVGVGLAVFRARVRRRRQHHDHHHHDCHGHNHGHEHAHEHGHHHHHMPDRITSKGLLAMGAAAGLIPCPSALVVLLGAIAQQQIALGLVLIFAFSAGLACTLVALGLAVVYGQRLFSRVPAPARLVTALPAASAVVIVGVGFVLTAQALPQLA
jgi:nickel/cobalt transporter (NicO) family protein